MSTLPPLEKRELELARPMKASAPDERCIDGQVIFDTVCKHLAQQGGQSITLEAGCAYRGGDGRKCAVGCLLTDGEYRAEMEGRKAMFAHLPARFAAFLGLLDDLQTAHDTPTSGAAVVAALRTAALSRDLSPAILDTLTFPKDWQ